jgi:FixJ family two-component response regulator
MKKGSVYLVDDDPSVLRALQRLLRYEGYEVHTFISGETFIEEHDPAASGCIVLDLTLSGMDGLKTYEKISVTRCAMPVIFLSGTADVPSSVRAMKAGAVDFLTKPVEPEVLIAAIKRALKLDAAQRKQRQLQQRASEKIGLLTRREQEVLKGVICGKMNKQIAADMGITEKTVKVHRSGMLQKLEARSVPELIDMAREAGLT